MNNYYQDNILLIRQLLLAKTKILQLHKWKVPVPSFNETLGVQFKGYSKFSSKFKYIAYVLQQFSDSPPMSRKKVNGDILFETSLGFDSDLLVYSGTVDVEYVSKRLGTEIYAPFDNHVFTHPDTQWFNISSRIGMKKYFNSHSQQIFDFFAALIICQLDKGKRPLLVSKQVFKNYCTRELEKRIWDLGYPDIRIITENWDKEDLDDQNIIPMIHYDIVGVNLFTYFDSAYCLNSYYLNNPIVKSKLQGCYPSDIELDVQLGTSGNPPRRFAEVTNSVDHNNDIDQLVKSVLYHEEMGVVLQAVGRVRPYTYPREIITFQCSDNLQLPYTQDFVSLHEARDYFGIKGRRSKRKFQTMEAVKLAKEHGFTQKQAAKVLDKGLRTIQRYWK